MRALLLACAVLAASACSRPSSDGGSAPPTRQPEGGAAAPADAAAAPAADATPKTRTNDVTTTGIDPIDRLIELRDLDRDALLEKVGASRDDVESGYGYEKLEGLDRLKNPDGYPANFFFRGEKLVMIYSSDPSYLEPATAAALGRALGEEGAETLRSRAGKKAKQRVHPNAGIAYSYEKEDQPVKFVEVFPPTDLEGYKRDVYKEPPAFRK